MLIQSSLGNQQRVRVVFGLVWLLLVQSIFEEALLFLLAIEVVIDDHAHKLGTLGTQS